MKLAELMQSVRLGSDVAETEPHLERYFLSTAAFRDFVEDDADLILGAKGTGKSAIFRMAISPVFPVPELNDVDLIPAFNPQGIVLFSRLPDGASEAMLRNVWEAYFVSVVGNHLLDTYGHLDLPDLELLRVGLDRIGLLATPATPVTSLWRRLIGGLQALSPEASVEFNEAGLPVLTGRILAQPQLENGSLDTDAPLPSHFDLEPILESEFTLFEQLDRRCWIVLDRLDEAFHDRPELEVMALRGLLRAHGDLCSHGRSIKTKIFLRSDVLDRITQQAGFVNLDHLRPITLTWTRDSIEDLITQRLIASESFSQAHADIMIMPPKRRRKALLTRLIPERITFYNGSKDEWRPGITWCLDRTTDATGEPGPRNLLTLLREARRVALARPELVDKEFETGIPLYGREDLQAAWAVVSKKRLHDTLYAEHNSLRPVVERFSRRPHRFKVEVLAEDLGFDPADPSFLSLVRELQYAGFIRPVAHDIYAVAELYMPALNIFAGTRRGKEKAPVISSTSTAETSESFTGVNDALKKFDDAIVRGDEQDFAYAADILAQVWKPTDNQLRARAAILEVLGGPKLLSGAWRLGDREFTAISNSLVRMLSSDATGEQRFWTTALRKVSENPRGGFPGTVPLLAASRLFAVSRGLVSIDDLKIFRAQAAKTASIWWPERHENDSIVRRLEGALWAYTRDPSKTSPKLHPYQVVSVYATLQLFGRDPVALRNNVVTVLGIELESKAPDVVSSFLPWARCSGIAAAALNAAGLSAREEQK